MRDELYRARRAILDLMPHDLEELLTSYYQCESSSETYRWPDNVAYRIIDLIPDKTKETTYFGEVRANYPLCGRRTQGPFDEGFKLPEGMRRHLTGYGNARQCDVMYAAEALARDYWYEQFSEEEAENERKKITDQQQRRASELLYCIGPESPPALIDEGVWPPEEVRSKKSMDWAEDRLGLLGFTVSTDGNVKSYTREMDGILVYADPRRSGRIDFCVYTQPREGSKKARGHKLRFTPTFYIMDRWKNDLPGKFVDRAREAIGRLRI
ncbi:MAG: hypothetical protein WD448_01970 [Woeseia sp.]